MWLPTSLHGCIITAVLILHADCTHGLCRSVPYKTRQMNDFWWAFGRWILSEDFRRALHDTCGICQKRHEPNDLPTWYFSSTNISLNLQSHQRMPSLMHTTNCGKPSKDSNTPKMMHTLKLLKGSNTLFNQLASCHQNGRTYTTSKGGGTSWTYSACSKGEL